MSRVIFPTALVFVAALALGGCGDTDDKPEPTGPASVSGTEAPEPSEGPRDDAAGGEEHALAGDPAPAPDTSAVVTFADTALAAAVRLGLMQIHGEQPQGPLRRQGLLAVEELDAAGLGIADLGGIEYLSNLRFLNLSDNAVEDLSPLEGLTALRVLALDRNRVRDLGPLAGLARLELLLLESNAVTQLDILVQLASAGALRRVDLYANPLGALARQGQTAALRTLGVEVLGEGRAPPEPDPGEEPTFASDIDPSQLKILFQSRRKDPDNDNVPPEIYTVDAIGGEAVDVFADLGGDFKPFNASWVPGSQRLLFAHLGELFTSEADGSGIESVPGPQGVSSLQAMAPDGSRIVYAAFVSSDFIVFEVPATGGDTRELINVSDALGGNVGYGFGMPISSDGRYIALTLFVGRQGDIYVVDLLNGQLTNVSNTPDTNEFGAAFAADGRRLFFASTLDGDSDIYAYDLEGGALENITLSDDNDFSPHPSPDGKKIAFQSDRAGSHDIFVMEIDGSNPTNLTGGGGGFLPQFSPDGGRIAFTRRVTEGNDVFVVNVDGSGLTNLTQSPGDDLLLSWSPR